MNTEVVYDKLKEQQRAGKIPPRYVSKEQAERVAWRILKDWVESQMAIVEAGMVKAEEVFLPYMLMAGDVTLFQAIESKMLQLPAGSEHPDDR